MPFTTGSGIGDFADRVKSRFDADNLATGLPFNRGAGVGELVTNTKTAFESYGAAFSTGSGLADFVTNVKARFDSEESGGGYTDPSSDATLSAWFRSDTSGGTLGNALSQWDDASGNTRHLTQATGGNQPVLTDNLINTHPAVVFDGTDDYLVNSSAISAFLPASSAYFAVVFRQKSSAPGTTNSWLLPAIFADNGGYLGLHMVNIGGTATLRSYIYSGGGEVNADKTVSLNTWTIAIMKWNGSNLSLSINGDTPNTAAAGSVDDVTNTLRVATNYSTNPDYADVDIAEMIFRNGQPSDEAAEISYLKTRYGIA